MPGMQPKTVMQAALGLAGLLGLVAGVALLGGAKKKKAA